MKCEKLIPLWPEQPSPPLFPCTVRNNSCLLCVCVCFCWKHSIVILLTTPKFLLTWLTLRICSRLKMAQPTTTNQSSSSSKTSVLWVVCQPSAKFRNTFVCKLNFTGKIEIESILFEQQIPQNSCTFTLFDRSFSMQNFLRCQISPALFCKLHDKRIDFSLA